MLADRVKAERLELTTSTPAGAQNDARKSDKIGYA